MATATKAKTTKAAPAKKAVPAKKAAPAKKVAATKTAAPKAAATKAPVKPIKDGFTKASLATHLAENTGVEPKSVKLVLAELESTMLGAVHKKGAKEFTLPGLLKISVIDVPAKKKRVGKDPFTGEMREFAAKPASIRIKARALKKLKDAAA